MLAGDVGRHPLSSADEARALALALPGAHEQDHHGRPSFRVGGRIFATLRDERHMNVMLDEDGVRTYVGRDPHLYAEVWWGRRLAAVAVALEQLKERELAELLADAWERRGGRASRP